MGYSEKAIRKGVTAEYLAKAWFSKQGYTILSADTHETAYDFIIEKKGEQQKVQVKAANFVGDIVRLRNKHGQNRAYKVVDYDLLCGVWVEESRVYVFQSKDINENGFGEAISVDTISGRKLSKHKRFAPWVSGRV